jgi:transmembrane sensor
MSDRHLSPELWRRLAEAQDALAADRRPLHDVEVGTRRRRIAPPEARSAFALRAGNGTAGFPRFARARLVALATAVLATGAAAWLFHRPALKFQVAGETGAAGRRVVAEAESELPLRFSDGSTLTFQPGSAGTVQQLGGAGAEVVVERGQLDAAVVHAERTLWIVRAGPFRVRVTGTRFSLTWSPGSGALTVALHEGSVLVDGGVLSAGVPLRAGQRLAVEVASGRVRTEPLAAPPVEVSVAPATRPVKRARAPEDWLALAERGEHAQALAAAERLGFPALCRRLGARELLALGDVARYAGAAPRARLAFEALAERFAGDPLAADAIFSLGRLAFEAQQPREAARWFERYGARWPDGPLAEQAAGRLVECARRAGEGAPAARAYLARFPGGPHAALAHEVLEGR